MYLVVKSVTDNQYNVPVDVRDSITDLKEKVAEETETCPDDFDLVYEGNILSKDTKVMELGIASHDEMEMIRSKKRSALERLGDENATIENLLNEVRNGGNLVGIYNDAGIEPAGTLAIQVACNNGNINVLNDLIACYKSSQGDQLEIDLGKGLLAASSQGHTRCVEELLRCHNTISQYKDSVTYRTPLHAAAHGGHLEIVELLVAAKCDLNAEDEISFTPLAVACLCGHSEVASHLLKHKADPTIQCKNGHIPLTTACARGLFDIVSCLLSYSHVDERDRSRRTPLNVASSWGRVEVVKLLLSHKAAVNIKDCSGRFPLISAAEGNQMEVMRLLLEANADVNLSDKNGKTILHESCDKEDLLMFNTILQYQPNINCVTKEGNTAFHIACKTARFHFLRPLLKHKCDYKIQNNFGKTALHVLCEGNPSKETEECLEEMMSFSDFNDLINTEDDRGSTPLSAACRSGSLKIIEMLTSVGANPNICDIDGRTPILYASAMGKKDIILHLLKHDADPEVRDKSYKTPLSVASDKEIYSILRIAKKTKGSSVHKPDIRKKC